MTPLDTDRWQGGAPLLTLICALRGHKPEGWRDTYQPHVQQQLCTRCGAWHLRTKPEGT